MHTLTAAILLLATATLASTTTEPPKKCGPICRMFCEEGFVLGEDGCPICKCKEPPMEPCPMPMCAGPCPNGYANDEQGCMTCSCKDEKEPEEPVVGPVPQPDGLMSMCQLRHDFALRVHDAFRAQASNSSAMLRQMRKNTMLSPPTCQEDGRFHPTQCNFHEATCWCVDDRGSPLPGSKTRVDRKEEIPQCARTVIHEVRAEFTVKHELTEVEAHYDNIKHVIHVHLSKWLLIKKEFIVVTKVEARPTKEQLLVVQFVIHQEGDVDLSHVPQLMMWHLQREHCTMPYRGTALVPQPTSLQITHHSPADGHHQPHHGRRHEMLEFVRRHRIACIAGGMAVLFLLCLAIASLALVCMRKRGKLQFKHKRLTEKSNTYKQNLAFANEVYGKLALHDEKKPGAEPEEKPESVA